MPRDEIELRDLAGNTARQDRVTAPISSWNDRWSFPMTREYERLIRLWRLAEMRRDLIAIIVVQSRLGRLTYALLEGAAARG
jgi:hypothetical protein